MPSFDMRCVIIVTFLSFLSCFGTRAYFPRKTLVRQVRRLLYNYIEMPKLGTDVLDKGTDRQTSSKQIDVSDKIIRERPFSDDRSQTTVIRRPLSGGLSRADVLITRYFPVKALMKH